MIETVVIVIISLIAAVILIDLIKSRIVKHEIKRIAENRDDLSKKQLSLLASFKESIIKTDTYIIGDCLYKGNKLKDFVAEESLNDRQIPNITSRLLNEKYSLLFNSFPKKVFIFIGSNDLNFEFPYTYIIKNTDLLIENIKKDYPECQINLFTLFPINRKSEDGFKERDGGIFKEDVEYTNVEFAKLAEKYNISLLDAYSPLSDKYGNLKKEYTQDGIFLNDFAIDEIIIPIIKNSL